VLQLLIANVRRDAWKLADPHRTEVVALVPAEAAPPRVAIAIRDPRARALEALDESRRVVDGRQLYQQMHVVAHDPHLDDPRAVPLGLGEQEWTEEISDGLIDERQARPGGPGEMGVETEGHALRIMKASGGDLTKQLRGASFRTRVVRASSLGHDTTARPTQACTDDRLRDSFPCAEAPARRRREP